MKTKKEKVKLQCSEALVSALKHFEGLRLEAYKCAGGVWTIGYGHTSAAESGIYAVKQHDRITEEWADELLRYDIKAVERQVLQLGVCYKQGQLDALVSLAFNIGFPRLLKSTLLRRIKQHETADIIQKEWKRWNRAGGKVLPGLQKRRQWESLRYFEDSIYLKF